MRRHVHSLTSVLVANEVRSVSDYAHLQPRRRPSATCPHCEEPVVLKLGDEYVHHAAHRRASDCPANLGEGAVHMNSKAHLHREMTRRPDLPLLVQQWCGCGASYGHPVCAGRIDTVLERKLGSVRPDITVMGDAGPLLHVEIEVTNPVSIEKEGILEDLGARWVAVQGREDFYSGNSPWTIERNLPVSGGNLGLTPYTCLPCLRRLAEERSASSGRASGRAREHPSEEDPVPAEPLDVKEVVREGWGALRALLREVEPDKANQWTADDWEEVLRGSVASVRPGTVRVRVVKLRISDEWNCLTRLSFVMFVVSHERGVAELAVEGVARVRPRRKRIRDPKEASRWLRAAFGSELAWFRRAGRYEVDTAVSKWVLLEDPEEIEGAAAIVLS